MWQAIYHCETANPAGQTANQSNNIGTPPAPVSTAGDLQASNHGRKVDATELAAALDLVRQVALQVVAVQADIQQATAEICRGFTGLVQEASQNQQPVDEQQDAVNFASAADVKIWPPASGHVAPAEVAVSENGRYERPLDTQCQEPVVGRKLDRFMNQIMINMQFQDRVNQRLEHVVANLNEICDRIEPSSVAVSQTHRQQLTRQWLIELSAKYTMQAEHVIHDGILEQLPAAEKFESGGFELF